MFEVSNTKILKILNQKIKNHENPKITKWKPHINDIFEYTFLQTEVNRIIKNDKKVKECGLKWIYKIKKGIR